MSAKPLVIDVFSDIACPWCFIGKKRLEKALAADGGPVEVRWHAYLLNPDLPEGGVDAVSYFTKKFGSMERIRSMWPRVAGLGAGEGIRFDFEGQTRAPNMRLAHRAVQLAQAQGKGAEAKEALFSGHFEQRLDVGNLDTVVALLEKIGLDGAKLRQDLADGAGAEEVDADLQAAREIGVTGVPFFIANGAVAMSGAQDVETFQRLFDEARRRTEKAGN